MWRGKFVYNVYKVSFINKEHVRALYCVSHLVIQLHTIHSDSFRTLRLNCVIFLTFPDVFTGEMCERAFIECHLSSVKSFAAGILLFKRKELKERIISDCCLFLLLKDSLRDSVEDTRMDIEQYFPRKSQKFWKWLAERQREISNGSRMNSIT